MYGIVRGPFAPRSKPIPLMAAIWGAEVVETLQYLLCNYFVLARQCGVRWMGGLKRHLERDLQWTVSNFHFNACLLLFLFWAVQESRFYWDGWIEPQRFKLSFGRFATWPQFICGFTPQWVKKQWNRWPQFICLFTPSGHEHLNASTSHGGLGWASMEVPQRS